MFLLCNDTKKTAQHFLESVLCFLRWDLRYAWLPADDQLKFGDKIDHELAVLTNSSLDIVPPLRQLCLVLTENLANQTLECLGKRRVRDVSLVLIELT